CARLAANPDAVLGAAGALPSVQAALDRWRVGNELAGIGGGPKQSLTPQQFVTFQCYVEDGAESAPAHHALTVAGQRFVAEEVRLPPAARAVSPLWIDRYDAVAHMLVPSFHYGKLLSEAGIEGGPSENLSASFSGRDYLLTRLYGLESVDI